jgi:hypothetical protein
VPVVVEDCTFSTLEGAIRIAGRNNSGDPLPLRSVVARRNRVVDCGTGIYLTGLLNDVQAVANRIWNSSNAGIDVSNLLPGSSNILLANNSIQAPGSCIRFVEPIEAIRDLEVRNNLLVAEGGPDMAFLGKDRAVMRGWQIRQNVRRTKVVSQADPGFKEWIPATNDGLVDRIEFLSPDPAHADFFRPADYSAVAKGGAGPDGPWLPSYVGAVPPRGAEPWDWELTWNARMRKAAVPGPEKKNKGTP